MIINLEIIRYFDLDFAGCLDNRRSTFSYVFMLAEGDVSWKSVKQSIIATFTMEAKFIACYKVSNQAIWLQNFISGLRIVDGIERPLRIKLYSKNNRSLLKSKHIDWLLRREFKVFRCLLNILVQTSRLQIRLPKVYHLNCFMSTWLVWLWFILVIYACIVGVY